MKKKIQRSMVLVLFVTLILFYGILAVILYDHNLSILEGEVRQEAKYVQAAINISGTDYLEQMDDVDRDTRLTQIAPDGEVLYDSRRDENSIENHRSRPEVQSALQSGTGEDVRMSDTVGREMYYYAVLLNERFCSPCRPHDGRTDEDRGQCIPGNGRSGSADDGICRSPCKVADQEADQADQ